MAVIEKIEALARAIGVSNMAAVENAVDLALAKHNVARLGGVWAQFDAILAQIDQLPDLANAFDPLEWDEHDLPR